MTEEKQKFSFEKRVEGAEKLLAALTEAGIAAEVIAKKGKVETFDSVRIRVSDKKGTPAGDLTIDGAGYITAGYVYTDGEQKSFARALDVAEELQGIEPSDRFQKVQPSPKGGGSFLGKLS